MLAVSLDWGREKPVDSVDGIVGSVCETYIPGSTVMTISGARIEAELES